MSTLLIKNLSVVEEISDETAASIYAGMYRRPRGKLEASKTFVDEPEAPVPGGSSGGLYPGLGNQADNVTSLFRMFRM